MEPSQITSVSCNGRTGLFKFKKGDQDNARVILTIRYPNQFQMYTATHSSLLHTITCLIIQTPQSRSKSTRLCLTSSTYSLEPEHHQRITANTSTSRLFTHGKEMSMFSTKKFHTDDVNLSRISIDWLTRQFISFS